MPVDFVAFSSPLPCPATIAELWFAILDQLPVSFSTTCTPPPYARAARATAPALDLAAEGRRRRGHEGRFVREVVAVVLAGAWDCLRLVDDGDEGGRQGMRAVE